MSLLSELLALRTAPVQASNLHEGAMHWFADNTTLSFDPDRTDVYDIVHDLMPLLVKIAFVHLMEDKEKHDKMYHDEPDNEFEYTEDTLADKVQELAKAMCERFDDMSAADYVSAVNHTKTKLKVQPNAAKK
jgi:hypothetical protein